MEHQKECDQKGEGNPAEVADDVSALANPASAVSTSFREGMTVQLHSLSATNLNGKIGRCGRFKKGRYAVLLDNGKRKVAVRPQNLQVVPAKASAAPSNSVFEELELRSFVVGDTLYQSNDLCTFSQYSKITAKTKKFLLDELALSRNSKVPTPLSRATASLVGLAIADAAGHPFEFMPVVDEVGKTGQNFDINKFTWTAPMNRFRLKPGQWTDDASMALCMADSLIAKVGFDGSDMRIRFWNWWVRSYNTAFGNDKARSYGQTAVGLGGNISKSIFSCKAGVRPSSIFQSTGEDSGNGSLMRLAPIPIFYSQNPGDAIKHAQLSSLTTHPGQIAAEACGFLSFLIQSAITSGKVLDPKAFLDERAVTYQKVLRGRGATKNGIKQLLLLLDSKLPENSTERSWNWKSKSLEINKTLRRRGRSYNGYPVSRGYYGAYSMDGLAVALYCVYHTTTFADAVQRVVNFLGDADSTGAIVGQLAGAIYGYERIPPHLLNALKQWDDESVTLRAIILYKAGCLPEAEKKQMSQINFSRTKSQV